MKFKLDRFIQSVDWLPSSKESKVKVLPVEIVEDFMQRYKARLKKLKKINVKIAINELKELAGTKLSHDVRCKKCNKEERFCNCSQVTGKVKA